MKPLIIALLMLTSCLIAQTQNMALQLDGAGDYAIVYDAAILNPADSLTIEAWVLPKDNPIMGMRVVDKMTVGSVDAYLIDTYPLGRCRFITEPTSAVNSADTLALDTWNHVAAVYDGQSAKIYLNGVLDTMVMSTGQLSSSSNPLLFGANNNYDDNWFNGMIDEVRLWNAARTQEQIIQTMNDTLPPAYYASADSHLIGYWRFDSLEDLGIGGDGSDDTRDYSIHGNHADLNGDAELSQTNLFVSVSESSVRIPDSPVLYPNYPNPFNPSTTIRYTVSKTEKITISIFDLLGRNNQTLVYQHQNLGKYKVTFDAGNLPSGIYFYRIQTSSGFQQCNKMVLLR